MFPSSQMVRKLLVCRPHLEHQVLEKSPPLRFWARYVFMWKCEEEKNASMLLAWENVSVKTKPESS